MTSRLYGLKRPLRYLMSALYVTAGVSHFRAAKTYERIVPLGFPARRALVYLSGIAEIALGLGVLDRRTRRASAWGLVVLLFCVFPANVYMATHDVLGDSIPERRKRLIDRAAWIRLPLQGVLVLWAWWYTQPTPEETE